MKLDFPSFEPQSRIFKARQLYPHFNSSYFSSSAAAKLETFGFATSFLCASNYKIHMWPCLSCQLIRKRSFKATALLGQPPNCTLCIDF